MIKKVLAWFHEDVSYYVIGLRISTPLNVSKAFRNASRASPIRRPCIWSWANISIPSLNWRYGNACLWYNMHTLRDSHFRFAFTNIMSSVVVQSQFLKYGGCGSLLFIFIMVEGFFISHLDEKRTPEAKFIHNWIIRTGLLLICKIIANIGLGFFYIFTIWKLYEKQIDVSISMCRFRFLRQKLMKVFALT